MQMMRARLARHGRTCRRLDGWWSYRFMLAAAPPVYTLSCMHIAFLLQDIGSVYGAERATLDLACGLQQRGCAVTLMLMRETRLALQHSALYEEIVRLGLPVHVVEARGRMSYRLVRAVRSLLYALNVDVLHTIGYKADCHGGWATGFGRYRPVVSTVHGWLNRADWKERAYGMINRQVLKRFQAVIVLSRYYERWLHTWCPRTVVRIPSGFYRPTHDAGALPVFSPPPPFPFTVGMMGRLSEEKNHAMCVRVAERVARLRSDVRFLIAGEGALRPAIEASVAAAGLEEQVRLLGYTDSPSFFRRIHVAVMCSRIENLPYTLLESMYWTRPVVATRVGGIPDLVEDGHTGYLVDGDDDAAMAQHVSALAADPVRRECMGKAGRHKLEHEFAAAQALDRHIELYEAVMKRS